jgi:hypothetical protein
LQQQLSDHYLSHQLHHYYYRTNMMETISPASSLVDSSNNTAADSNSSPSAEGNRIDIPLINDVLCGRGYVAVSWSSTIILVVVVVAYY